MKIIKFIAALLTASVLVSGMPDFRADTAKAETYEKYYEHLDRGLVAMNVNNGIYLSWRLDKTEDSVFGSAEENVAFNIYRDKKLIATESKTTNYLDSKGSTDSVYTVEAVNGAFAGEMSKEVSAFASGSNYFEIPLEIPEPETISYPNGTEINTYYFFPADCSAGDLDGDGEYEIIVKWTSNERDVGSPGENGDEYSGTVRFGAYKLDGTKLWENDINLGRNVYSSAHTVQFLVYDFDGDGKAEMMCQTSLGSKDASGAYVSHSAKNDSSISGITDTENETADYRGYGRIITGREFLTVFNGETGIAMDTIDFPTKRIGNGESFGDDFGNRSNRFLADIAYLDGVKPYAVYLRGYYFGRNYRQRTGISGISFDGNSLNVDYQFDTLEGQPGYYEGAEIYVGQGNHNCTVADVDGDGKDEFITGALCMEVKDDNSFKPRWCTFMEHGDALHIGDYDPTHDGYEFFTVHEDSGPNTMSGETVNINYGMSVIDANTGEIMFHEGGGDDTGRGVMANVGAGGYYQIWSSKNSVYYCSGGTNYTTHTSLTRRKPSMNFRIFWDGDLYDELLDGTTITSWNGSRMTDLFKPTGVVSVNGTKANPSLQADLFGDWREELVYPKTNGSALRVYTTNIQTNYKMASLMQDGVYRAGVAAEQTAYNQPPHIGYYMDDDSFNASKVQVNVSDENGTPIEGAKVSIGDNTVYTDENGSVSAKAVKGDSSLVAVSRSGYENYEETLVIDKEKITLDITLKKTAAAVSSLKLEREKITLKTDSYDVINAKVLPCSADEKITYASGNTDIAEISENGVIHAKKAGNTDITVTAGNISVKCAVSVVENNYEPQAQSIEITGEDSPALNVRQTTYLPAYKAYVYDQNGVRIYTDEISWRADTAKIEAYGDTAMLTAEPGCEKTTLTASYRNIRAEKIIEFAKKDSQRTIFNADFSDSKYSAISMFQGTEKQTAVIDSITFNVGNRGSLGDGVTGFKGGTEGITASAGKWANADRHAYMTINDIDDFNPEESYVFDMNIFFENNSGNIIIKIGDGDEIITSFRAGDKGLEYGKWYDYQLTYSDGQYTEHIYDENEREISTSAINSEAVNISRIDFAADSSLSGEAVKIRSMSLMTLNAIPSPYTVMVNVEDKDGSPVSGRTVSVKGTNKNAVTNKNGIAYLEVYGGINVFCVDSDEKYQSVLVNAEENYQNVVIRPKDFSCEYLTSDDKTYVTAYHSGSGYCDYADIYEAVYAADGSLEDISKKTYSIPAGNSIHIISKKHDNSKIMIWDVMTPLLNK